MEQESKEIKVQERKKYWLKLDKDFLKSPQMKVIKNMPNGKDYIIFYLSLMLESVETVGHLRFTSLVPYNADMLSAITDTNVDIVKSAIKIFCELGLMQIFDDGTIFMTEVPKITGKECESAERVRRFREKQKQEMLQCNDDVTKCNAYIEEEKEKEERKKNIEEEKEKENIYTYIEKNFGRTLSPIEYEQISKWEDNELTRYAIKQAILNGAYNFKYINTILNNWKKKHITTIQEAIQDDENFKKKTQIKNTNPEWYDKDIQQNIVSKKQEQEFLEKLKKLRGE